MTSTEATAYQEILFAKERGVATITINREKRGNAFMPSTLRELIDAFGRAGADAEVGVVVLTGAGGRFFCAGGDMAWEQEGGLREMLEDPTLNVMNQLYDAMRACLKPIIARVDGYAIGGGNHLAYHCDLTIASDRSVFGQNGARVGSPATGSIVAHAAGVIGHKRAREMWMLCRRYSAQDMLQWGLVNAVVPPEELDAEVRTWADEILALSPTVIKGLKHSFDEAYHQLRDFEDTRNFVEEVNPGFWDSGEQLEGANAFLEKRAPDFSPWR